MILPIFLITVSIINILYIYPVIKAAFFDKCDQRDPYWMVARKNLTIPFSMSLAIVFAVVISMAMSIFISPITAFLNSFHLS